MREDFLSIKKMIEQSKRDKIYLIKNAIPGISNVNSWEILEQLGYVFNEQKFLKNDYLSYQGEKSNTMFILVSGKLEVTSIIEMEIDDPQQQYMSKLNKFVQSSNYNNNNNNNNNDIQPSKKQQKDQKVKKNSQGSPSSIDGKNDQQQSAQFQEQIEIKICDIDTPQFICEDILAFRFQQYNVKVISSKALCYVITKRQFQSKFPRESVEMTKQLFLSKQQRRSDVINQQMLKYKDKFKIVERQESLNEQNKRFKQKFKKQYLHNIYAQSILKTNEQKPVHNKDLIFQYEKTEEEAREYREAQQKRFTEAKLFLQNASSPKQHEEKIHISDDSKYHKEYMVGLNEMKKNFSDYILDCVKKQIDSNSIVTFKQKQSINNHQTNNSSPKNSPSDLYNSLKRLSIIDENESIPSDSKRDSLFSNLGDQHQRESFKSQNLIIFKLNQEEKSNHMYNFYNKKESPQSRASLLKMLQFKQSIKQAVDLKILKDIDGKGTRKSILMSSPQNQNKSDRMSVYSQIETQNRPSLTKDENLEIVQNKDMNMNNESDVVLDLESGDSSQCQDFQNFGSFHLSGSSSPSIPSIQFQKQSISDNPLNSYQRQSLFKVKKETNTESIHLLPLKNLISSDKLNALKNETMKASPSMQSELISGQKSPTNFSSPKNQKAYPQPQPVDEEKSFLIEGTWNMGNGNLKQLEMDLKMELKNRGLLKIDQKTDIKNYFPQLDTYQKTKIEQKIKKIKEQSLRFENQVSQNISVSIFQEYFPPSIKSMEIDQGDHTAATLDIGNYQKNNPSIKIDASHYSLKNQKQYSSPVIQARSHASSLIDAPHFLPKITKNSSFVQYCSQQAEKKNNLMSKNQYSVNNSPSARYSKYILLASSLNQSADNRYNQNSRGKQLLDEIDFLQGIKCGSPLSQKNSFPNNTPISILQKSGQHVLGNDNFTSANSGINNIPPSKDIEMKDAIIQTTHQSSSNYKFYASDSLVESSFSSLKKHDLDPLKQQNLTQQGQEMIQRINYQRPIIIHNVMNRDKIPIKNSNPK